MDRTLLKIIADNPSLTSVLRQTIESKFSLDNLTVQMDDRLLGQLVRARLDGLRALDEAFREIARYKTTAESPPRPNSAR